VLVVQKQLLLKEEVRITRRRHEVREPQRVALRSEHVEVERFDERISESNTGHGQAQHMPAEGHSGSLPGS
jgi:stress response protein YsnF